MEDNNKMNSGSVDEFGNNVEFVKESSDNKATLDEFEKEAKEKALFLKEIQKNEDFCDEKCQRNWAESAKGAVGFAGDAIGLTLLKLSGNKELAYKVIKGGRKLAQGTGAVVLTTVTTGKKANETLHNHVDVEGLKERATEIRDGVYEKIEAKKMNKTQSQPIYPDSDFETKQDPFKVVKNFSEKVTTLLDQAGTKVEEMKEKRDEKSEAKRQEDVAKKVAEFEALYKDEKIEETIEESKKY